MKKIFVMLSALITLFMLGCGTEEKKPVTESKPVPQASNAKIIKQESIELRNKDGVMENVDIVKREDGNWYNAKTGERVYYQEKKVKIGDLKGGEFHKFK